MNKIRKFFRGSGRVLAFIFVASVIWLLFDMAALRLSFSEISTGVLKEHIRRREQTGFKVQPNRMKIRHSSITGMRLPQNRLEDHTLKNEENMDQVQRRWKMQISLGRGKVMPLWHPAHLQTLPVPLTMQKTVGRDSKPEASSQHMSTKQTTVLSQRTPSTASRGTPLTTIPVHTKTFAKIQEASKNHTLSSNASKTLNMTIIVRTEPSEHQSQTVTKLKTRFVSPPILEYGEAIAIKKTELNHKTHKVLPLSKFVADASRLNRQMVNKTQLRGLSEDGVAKVAPEKKVSFSESQIVIITKEEDLGTDTKKVSDSKTLTVIPKLLGASQGKHIPGNQSMTSSSLLAPQRSVSQAKLALARGLHPARSNLTSKSQTVGHQQSHTNTSENPGRHRVLRIDLTLSPRDPNAPGQFGRAVVVPPGKEKEAERRWREGNFNVYLSDLIPVDRAIEDTRPAGCAEQLVHNDLPTTSIIMCFVDEVWSALLRSVHSVLNRSPPHLIKEILLVDDFSTKEYLKENLDKYMSQFPKVRILRLKERHGLIRARLAGAQNATGDVLTFLDSHVECNVGWLEPLLERVYINRQKVACPVIEVINDKDMSYMTVDNFQRGVFTWPMNFGWRTIPPDVVAKNGIKETDIIRCPVMAGGLFSIDKSYFYELGTYDPGLDVWGGENMELSFKVWMCGGEIEIIPCSRVGHIFRNDNPYSFPKDRLKTVERNLVRVAEVWLDEYKELFYGHGDHLIDQGLDVGNLTQQRELRKRLKCKSFKWYLDNVFPDLKAPIVRASGVLVNVALGRCVSIENTTATLEDCDGSSQLQQFNYTWVRLIKHGDWCMAAITDKGSLRFHHPCDYRDNRLKWLHKSTSGFHPELVDHIVFEHYQQLLCMEGDFSQKTLKVAACNPMKPYQKWKFEKYYEG
ncbi:polypeptide N-acetylgalactosaminyltransferase 5 [Phodopus roborovskii]|uniref:Polypeptide N-acetylgalactosaminyltransferase n=1 Tax=Phodopus roborovskii TaxID=109678 RepID=A0AAU9ZBF6_PHORO|nr:polypeptide N-acetylgalactosaminyltransferase 5 [Phodopus roborovskii]CAH6788595.1 Galnt5 [Phodopus roborovskii]